MNSSPVLAPLASFPATFDLALESPLAPVMRSFEPQADQPPRSSSVAAVCDRRLPPRRTANRKAKI